MTRKIVLFFVFASLVLSCTNLENAKPANLNAFTYFYGGTGNYQATAAIEVSDGYLVTGNNVITYSSTLSDYGMVVIKTDRHGATQWRKTFPHSKCNSIQTITNGYMICGNSIKIDLAQSRDIDKIRTEMRLIILSDADGSTVKDTGFGDTTKAANDTTRFDVQGSAITIDANQNYIATSTVNYPNSLVNVNTYTQVTAFDPQLILLWTNSYNQDNTYNYANGRTVTTTQLGNIIWATSAIKSNATSATGFVRLPVYSSTGALVNGANYGQDDGAYYSGNDVKSNGVGFGIVGTYQNTSGLGANVFFVRTDPSGNVDNGSALFFDGPTCSNNKPLSDKTVSAVQDQGIALTATQDGGFLLAGYTTSTTDGKWGNGGTDVYLIRLDPFGNMLWNHFLGGSGDEVPSSVVQTSDGGFLISGTLTLAGQSSMFMMKTNTLGELKN